LENDLIFDWVNSDIFHHASIKGYLKPFIDVVKGKNIIFVGPEYLESLSLFSFFPYYVPEKNAWLEYDKILFDLLELTKTGKGIMLFCAGMTTNVLISNLWAINKQWTYIDAGSVFDPYAGRQTRSYHKDLKL
jgi:hypothetical protein